MCFPTLGIHRTGPFNEWTSGSLSHTWMCGQYWGGGRSEHGQKAADPGCKTPIMINDSQPCVLWRLCGCFWTPAPLLLQVSEARCCPLLQLWGLNGQIQARSLLRTTYYVCLILLLPVLDLLLLPTMQIVDKKILSSLDRCSLPKQLLLCDSIQLGGQLPSARVQDGS